MEKIHTQTDKSFLFEKSISEARALIEAGIWKEISVRSLDNWAKYFESEDEKLLCGLLLDSLIYRCTSQTKALLSNNIEKSIQNLIYPNQSIPNNYLFDVLTAKFPGENKDKFKIVPVIRDIDPPTKSGPLVARMYKKLLSINDKFMLWPWQLEGLRSAPEAIILIDDFVGTGDQFIEFYNKYILSLESKFPDSHIIYAPLGACEVGIKNINDHSDRILLCNSELIQSQNKFFTGMALRYDGVSDEFICAMKDTYKKFMMRIGHEKLRNLFGYGDLELTFSYAHGTPNATLPIFWAANNDYQPIFSR